MVEITRDDLQEMVNETGGLASWESVWRLLSGCTVVHEKLGSGTILDQGGGLLSVRFGSEVRQMSLPHLHHFVVTVDIPDSHPFAERARAYQSLEILVEKQRPLLESWGIDPKTVGRRDVGRLSAILEFMDTVPAGFIEQVDREFLERSGFAWVEAIHLERSMKVGSLIKAAQIWRRCGDPDESVRIAMDILHEVEPGNRRTRANALTILANGLLRKGRQTGTLALRKEAIGFALKSAELVMSFEPLLIAEAAAKDLGDQEVAQDFRKKAVALGAPPRALFDGSLLAVVKPPKRKIRPETRPPADRMDFLLN